MSDSDSDGSVIESHKTITKRIFLGPNTESGSLRGQIPPSVTQSNVMSLLSPFCTVNSIDFIPTKDDSASEGEAPGVRCVFASVSGEEQSISECIRRYNGTKWRGVRLRVEPATEHYLERLEREKKEMATDAEEKEREKRKKKEKEREKREKERDFIKKKIKNPNVLRIRAKDDVKLMRVNMNKKRNHVTEFTYSSGAPAPKCEDPARYAESEKKRRRLERAEDEAIAQRGRGDVEGPSITDALNDVDIDPVLLTAERRLALSVAQRVISKPKGSGEGAGEFVIDSDDDSEIIELKTRERERERERERRQERQRNQKRGRERNIDMEMDIMKPEKKKEREKEMEGQGVSISALASMFAADSTATPFTFGGKSDSDHDSKKKKKKKRKEKEEEEEQYYEDEDEEPFIGSGVTQQRSSLFGATSTPHTTPTRSSRKSLPNARDNGAGGGGAWHENNNEYNDGYQYQYEDTNYRNDNDQGYGYEEPEPYGNRNHEHEDSVFMRPKFNNPSLLPVHQREVAQKLKQMHKTAKRRRKR